MDHIYEKEFDFVISRAKSLDRPARMVVAGAECENIIKAVFEAEAQGFCEPILVGYKDRIVAMLKELGLHERKYVLSDVTGCELPDLSTDYHIYMKRAISIINDGLGDILVRGNTSTRNFLIPILDKKNNLTNGLVSEVALLKVPYYDKVLALSDVSVLINPSEGQRKKVVKNIVYVLEHLGIHRPKIVVLALLIYMATSLLDLRGQIQETQALRNDLAQKVTHAQLENRQLSEAIADSEDPAVMEQVARSKGYVREDEVLYIDVAN